MTFDRHSNAVVLLPTYNERENIALIVPAILQAASVDIMILDDNSPDGTGALADALAQQYAQVHVVHRTQKAGLGAAYLDGFQRALAAGYDYIIEMDADFSHPPSLLPTFLERAQAADLILGSRWIQGGGIRNWPLLRKFISLCGSLYARIILGVSIRDLTGGFKCFTRKVLESLPLEHIKTTGYGFQIEMTYRAIQQGFRVVEVPFVFVERERGASKMTFSIAFEAIIKVPLLRFEKKS